MYLGANSAISLVTPGEQTKPPEKPSVIRSVVNEILEYRDVYGDEVWNEFRAWHRAEYLPSWRVRMPFPDPERYYKTFESFAVDWGTFEDTIPPMRDPEDELPATNGEDAGDDWDNGWGTNGEDRDWYYDTGGTEEESDTNWPMLIAIGTGAAALVLLMRK